MISLIINLYESKKNIQINIKEKKYNFKFDKNKENIFFLVLFFEDENFLEISEKSKIEINKFTVDKKLFKKIKFNHDFYKSIFFIAKHFRKYENDNSNFNNDFRNYLNKKNFNKQPKIVNYYFSLNNFWNENIENCLIGKCWAIIYNLFSIKNINEKNIKLFFDYLIFFSLDSESKILKFLFEKFKFLINLENKNEKIVQKKIDDLIKFSKSMINVFNKNSVLFLIDTKFKSNFNFEINNFKKNHNNQEILDLIKNINNEIEEFNNVFEINDFNNVKKYLIEKLNNFVNNFEEKNLIEKNKILKENKKKLSINSNKKILNNFLKYKFKEEDLKYSNELLILDEIIWYSKIFKSIKNIFESKNEQFETIKINNLNILSNYEEIENIIKIILNIKNVKDFTQKIYENCKFILTSIFLDKLYEKFFKKEEKNSEKIINNLKVLLSIDSYINNFIKRNEIKDNEIKWAYENIINLPFNDILYLPEINENVIENLFIHSISDEKFKLGPILHKEYGRLPLQKFYNNYSKTYLYYLTNICKDIFIKNFDVDKENDINEIKNILENEKYQKYLIFYKFFCFDFFHKFELKYDDYDFLLEKNWVENEDFMKKFPSFFLWLNQNYNYYDEYLKKEFENCEKKESSMSFFLLFLRMLTTKNYLNYLNINENKYYSLIVKIITKIFQENKFDNFKDLINLFCTESLIKNSDEIYFNKFLNNLSNDSFENNKNNSDLILKFVLDKIEKLYENVINFSFNEMINNSIESDELIDFFFHPEENLKKNIYSLKQKEINKNYEKIINILNDKLNKENENKNLFKILEKNYFNKIDEMIIKEKEKNFFDLKNEIEIYKQKINLFNNFYSKFKEDSSKLLENLNSEENQILFFELENLNSILIPKIKNYMNLIIIINYLDYEIDNKNNRKVFFNFKSKIIRKKIEISKNEGKFFYFDDFIFDGFKPKTCEKKKEIKKIELYEIKTNNKLIFGKEKNFSENEFKTNIKQSIYEIKNFLYDFINIDENNFNKKLLQIEKIKRFKGINNFFYVNFENEEISENFNNFLSEMKQKFDEFFKLMIELNEIGVEINFLFENKNFFFDRDYSLKIIDEKNIIFKELHFENIKINENFLSTPILFYDEINNKINSNFLFFNFDLGPLYSNYFNECIKINILSLINKKFYGNIQNENNSGKFNLEITNDYLIIYYKLPELLKEKDEKEIIEKSKINLWINENNKTIFDFNIKYKLIPLKFLLSCDNHKLYYSNNIFKIDLFYIHNNEFISINIQNFFHIQNLKKIIFKVELNNNNINIYYNNEKEKISPYLLIKNDNIKIYPKNNSNEFLNFILKIFITKTFIIPIEINLITTEFDFSFEIYDFNNKKFTNNNIKIFLNKKDLPLKNKLYFRIFVPENNINYKIKLSDKKISEKKLINNNEFNIKEKKFNIINKKYFEIDFNIISMEFEFIYSISLEIREKKKRNSN